jgi:hypothetical protein
MFKTSHLSVLKMGKRVSALLNIDSAAKQILHSSTRSMHAINYIKTLKKVFYLYIYIYKIGLPRPQHVTAN